MVIDHPRLRIYALKGRRTFLAWCRDKQNTWQTELAEGKQPEVIENVSVSLPKANKDLERSTISFYDPWSNQWTQGRMKGSVIRLPDFSRSLVIKIQY